MDNYTGGRIPLVKNGSVYDLVATYIFLLERVKPTIKHQNELMQQFMTILDKGYTYQEIHADIMRSFHSHVVFPFSKYTSKRTDGNLLKQNTRYYHKELNLMSQLRPVMHNVDTGEITSGDNEYWIEPRASYTLEDLAAYFYSKDMVDKQEYFPKRIKGILNNYVSRYGIDVTLFMIEHAARVVSNKESTFSMSTFDTYRSIAMQYLEEIKNSCVYSGGNEYVPRKRMLFA